MESGVAETAAAPLILMVVASALLLLCASGQTPAAAPPKPSPKPTPQVQALIDAGKSADLDWKQSLVKFDDAYALAVRLEDRSGQGVSLFWRGRCYAALGQPQRALELYVLALPIRREVGDRGGEANTLNNVGLVYSDLGQPQRALEQYALALAIYREVGDRGGEANTLNNVGTVYRDLGQPQRALEQYALALPIYREVRDRSGEATTLNNSGAIYAALGQPQRALEQYALALPMFREIGDRGGEASTLSNVGLVYSDLGQPQRALEQYALALPIYRKLGDRGGEAITLINLGLVYRDLGQPRRALEQYALALLILREVGDRGGEARTLNNIGTVYSALGQPQRALEQYSLALPIYRQVGDRGGEARTLNNVGLVYRDLGQPQRALEQYALALPIYREVGDRRGEATTLNNRGAVYAALGQPRRALEQYGLALPIYREVGDRRGEANTLGNVGAVYSELGQPQQALEQFALALPIYREVGDRNGEARMLNNIGAVDRELGQPRSALEQYGLALPIYREVGDRGGEGHTLNNIGAVYRDLGQPARALEQSILALSIYREVGDRSGEANSLGNIGAVYRGEKRFAAEVFFLTRSVSVYEALRSEAATMMASQRRSLAESQQAIYRALAVSMARLGRGVEFQGALALAGSETAAARTLPESPIETRWTEGYEARLEATAQAGRTLAQRSSVPNPTSEDKKEIANLTATLAAAQSELARYLDAIATESEIVDPKANRVESTEASRAMDATLAALPQGTAAVYALPGDGVVHLLVVRRDRSVSRTVPVADLDQVVRGFVDRVGNRESDLTDLHARGKALYDLLVAPIATELDPKGTTMWSLSGSLRKLPLAALWDGERYLVEKYPISLFSPAQLSGMVDASRAVGPSLVFGTTPALSPKDPITEEPVAFGRLPGVGKETADVGRELGATPTLDGAFTAKSLVSGLKTAPRVVHLASHFRSVPGDDRRSFLLTGDGGTWTVEGMKELPEDALKGVELVTLSACATATNESATGAETESFGAWMRRKGAKSVISTLWPIADDGTAVLMADFYRRWKPGTSKLDALRKAQLAMLRSTGTGAGPDRAEPKNGDGAKPVRATGYSHPYYWAPFVLTGNWR